MYGPTVVITTFVDSARRLRLASSVLSASINGRSCLPCRSRTASSLLRLRPASAQRVPSVALLARYSAVRPPVNPVAPNSTTSCSRSATAHLLGALDRLLRRDASLRRDPARDRRGDALGSMRCLGRQLEQLPELLGRRWIGPELAGEGLEPLGRVHRRALTNPDSIRPSSVTGSSPKITSRPIRYQLLVACSWPRIPNTRPNARSVTIWFAGRRMSPKPDLRMSPCSSRILVASLGVSVTSRSSRNHQVAARYFSISGCASSRRRLEMMPCSTVSSNSRSASCA